MGKQRLEAFTDGVLAIAITIMVLDIHVPPGTGVSAFRAILPILFVYALSFTNVGIFWNNHHHMLHAADKVDGRVLWANLFLLFWMSLVPLVIRWTDESHFAPLPTASYGIVLGMAGVAYILLERALIKCNGSHSRIARAVKHDMKERLSIAMYLLGIATAFVRPWISLVIYTIVAMSWFIPDRRIETVEQLK